MGDWLYRQTDGLGLVEYLEWCVDLEMELIMGVWSGYSLTKVAVPEEDLAPYVQAALDQVSIPLSFNDTLRRANEPLFFF